MKRIKFDESKFKVNAYIKETIELYEIYGETLEIVGISACMPFMTEVNIG